MSRRQKKSRKNEEVYFCPECGAELKAGNKKSFKCPSCNERLQTKRKGVNPHSPLQVIKRRGGKRTEI